MIQGYLYTSDQPVTIVSDPQMFKDHVIHEREGLLWVDIHAWNDQESECLVERFRLHPLTCDVDIE
jgi:Mg2+ and Co2+ transporter CorA